MDGALAKLAVPGAGPDAYLRPMPPAPAAAEGAAVPALAASG